MGFAALACFHDSYDGSLDCVLPVLVHGRARRVLLLLALLDAPIVHFLDAEEHRAELGNLQHLRQQTPQSISGHLLKTEFLITYIQAKGEITPMELIQQNESN